MMLTFVANDKNGLPQKRKHVQRACEKCRKRKKRCSHLDDSDTSGSKHKDSTDLTAPHGNSNGKRTFQAMASATLESSPSSLGDGSNGSAARPQAGKSSNGLTINSAHRLSIQGSRARPQELASTPGPTTKGRQALEDGDSSFVGDLNPEAIFLAAASPQTTISGGNEGVGVWSTHKVIDSIRSAASGSRRGTSDSILNADPVVSRLLLPYLQDQCMKLLPPHLDYVELEIIFLEEVQPIIPVLDEAGLENQPDNESTILLKQAVCLAASTNARAKTHLKFDYGLVSQKEFAEKLSRAIRTSLDLGLVRDKMVLIQVLSLLGLFMQLSDDKHLSADFNARTVSLVQTLGLHLRTPATRKDHAYVTRLFCCVWALDRMNAAFHGRPVLMHERDLGHDMNECISLQEPTFQLLLRNVQLLDKVINLYRPANHGGRADTAFPNFEQLLEESEAHRVKSHLIATIETFYHAVAMLSYRAQASQTGAKAGAQGQMHDQDQVAGESPQASTRAGSAITAAQLRQRFSAVRATSIVGDEFHHQLSLLPFVPYALSLALRVSYRDLRTSTTPIFRARARKQMLEQCKVLRELGQVFSSALVIVELAERTIKEMDKVTFNVVGQQKQQNLFSRRQSRQEPFAAEEQPHEISSDPERIQGNGGAAYQEPGPNGNPTLDQFEELGPLSSSYDPDAFDFTVLDDMAGFDVFEHFDPSIDLEQIDATLGDFGQFNDFMGFPG